MPNKVYRPQNPVSVVSANTPATIKRMMPRVPVSTSVKNNTAMITAIIRRIILSAVPMFVFILLNINYTFV